MSPDQDQLQDKLNQAERVAKVARETFRSSLSLSARLAATAVAMGLITSIIGTDNFQHLEQLIGNHPNLVAFVREFHLAVSSHPWLAGIVATIGPNLLASMWDRVAFSSKTSDKQIKELLLTALSGTETEKKIVELTKRGAAEALSEYDSLQTQEFYRALARLVRRLEEHHQELLQEYQTPTNFIPTFPITNLPPANPHFLGRADQLKVLEAAGMGQATAIIQAISGLGGIGKSQIMLHFAHKYQLQYDILWWLRVDEALTEGYLALGRQLALPVDTMTQAEAEQFVRNWLNGTDKQWLLLCDNADEIEPRALRQRLPSGRNGRILITSRNPEWVGLGKVVRLGVFSEKEAAVFWTEWLGYSDETSRVELAEELGFLPLALEHAAAYMRQNELDTTTYLALFRTRQLELFEKAKPPDDYHATITTTWNIAFEQASRTAGAAELLNLCCFFAPDNIPLTLLVGHASVLPKPLDTILADDLARNEALNTLQRNSLLSRSGGLLAIHRLVQMVARNQMGEEEAQKWVEAAVTIVQYFLPTDPNYLHEWADGPAIIPHVTNALKQAEAHNLLPGKAAFLNNQVGVYLYSKGDYAGARPYYERALAIRKGVFGPNHPAIATSLNNLGLLLKDTGDYTGARSYYERALVIWEEVLGSNHPYTATSLNNLGLLLKDTGDYTGARSYYERALTIVEGVLGPNHPNIATSLDNLGSLLKEVGDYNAARPYLERALGIREKALSPNHPDMALSFNNLGLLLETLGDYAGARQYLERALAIKEEVLDPNHPDTASSLNNLGLLLQETSDYAAARPYYERALAIQEEVLGPNHPDIATTLNNLGSLLQEMGDYTGARPYYERALTIVEDILGSNHPKAAGSLNNLGLLLQKIGDYAGARQYLERALVICEETLGPKHTHTQIARRNLEGLED